MSPDRLVRSLENQNIGRRVLQALESEIPRAQKTTLPSKVITSKFQSKE